MQTKKKDKLNIAYSFGWSKRKRIHVFSKMAAKLNLEKHRSPQCESITLGQPPSTTRSILIGPYL
jgi:hypothetical protein